MKKYPVIKALILALALFAPARESFGANTVASIDVEGLNLIEKRELLYLLGMEKDSGVTKESIRKGIKRAFLKGVFEDIIVEDIGVDEIGVEDAGGGAYKITVKERRFLDDIHVSGNDDVSDRFIREHSGLEEKGPLMEDSLKKAEASLLEALKLKGYPGATVAAALEETGRPGWFDVSIEVVEGGPILIKEINISGYDRQGAMKALGLWPGDVFDGYALESGIEALRARLTGEGFIKPRIGPYSFTDGALSLTIIPGKRVMVFFKGRSALNEETLRNLLPFAEAGAFGEDILDEAVAKILSIYHEEGYPFAQAAPVVSIGADGVTELRFFISEGRKVLVNSISITGASLDVEKLKAVMTLGRGEKYNPAKLESDIGTLREFYLSLGYLDVKIDPPRVVITESGAEIAINVNEGRSIGIKKVSIEGNFNMPSEGLLPLLRVVKGNPYNEIDIADSRYIIIERYRTHGYLDCNVEVKRAFEHDGAVIMFRVIEGAKGFFGRTVVTGNTETKAEVVFRELAYKEGERLDYRSINETRQRLYKLGIFSSVELDVLSADDNRSDILVKVAEGEPGAVEFGLGYGEYERYRTSLDIGYRNLFGLNRTLSVRTEQSYLDERYILHYSDPYFMDMKLPFRAILIKENKRAFNIDTKETMYKVSRYGTNLGVEQDLGRNMKSNLFYEYSVVKTYEVQPDVIITRDDTGTLSISAIKPAMIYDSRDNAFDPHSGAMGGVELKWATPLIFSEADFLKTRVHASHYDRLTRKLVLALSFQMGVARNFGEDEDLPLVERYFLGGRNTVRGYSQDSLGPKGADGSPTGGNAFSLANVEFRQYVGNSWSLVVFLDGGNVWQRTGRMDPSDLKYTAGLGIRYNTPVGPLRLDYGWKLEREPGESAGEVHFTIGHAF